jgi:hypothetical protein
MNYLVEFASVEHADRRTVSDGYDTFAEALAVARAHRDQGKFPTVRCPREGFHLSPFCSKKWGARPTLEWSFHFDPAGIYKSFACRAAERAGVRYASHRRGYIGSNRAAQRFAAETDASFAKGLAA